MLRRLLATLLLALVPAACSTTDDGEMTIEGVLNSTEFPDCENDGSCPSLPGTCPVPCAQPPCPTEPCQRELFCAQFVNVADEDRSPALCLDETICQRVTCSRGTCVITREFPRQVRCLVDD